MVHTIPRPTASPTAYVCSLRFFVASRPASNENTCLVFRGNDVTGTVIAADQGRTDALERREAPRTENRRVVQSTKGLPRRLVDPAFSEGHARTMTTLVREEWGNYIRGYTWSHFATLTSSWPRSPEWMLDEFKRYARSLERIAQGRVNWFASAEETVPGWAHVHALLPAHNDWQPRHSTRGGDQASPEFAAMTIDVVRRSMWSRNSSPIHSLSRCRESAVQRLQNRGKKPPLCFPEHRGIWRRSRRRLTRLRRAAPAPRLSAARRRPLVGAVGYQWGFTTALQVR